MSNCGSSNYVADEEVASTPRQLCEAYYLKALLITILRFDCTRFCFVCIDLARIPAFERSFSEMKSGLFIGSHPQTTGRISHDCRLTTTTAGAASHERAAIREALNTEEVGLSKRDNDSPSSRPIYVPSFESR